MPGHSSLSARLLSELDELEKTINRCLDIWSQFESTSDDHYLDGVAFNLQAFYTGVERSLELIIAQVDQDRPAGPNWHQVLLQTAATEIHQLRPAVISLATQDVLDRYRGFRHVARNIYGFEIDVEQLTPLIHDLRDTFERFKGDLERFAQLLAQAESDQEQDETPD